MPSLGSDEVLNNNLYGALRGAAVFHTPTRQLASEQRLTR